MAETPSVIEDTVDSGDLAFPEDTARSRLSRPPVSGFDPDDISNVDAKVAAFREACPEGRIDATQIVQVGDAWLVTARVWRTSDGVEPDSTGSALRTTTTDEGWGEYPLETAQSVAIGRALRFLGIQTGPS